MKPGIEVISREICGFMRKNVIAEGVPFDEESAFGALGVDSFSLIEILLFVERRFGVVVPEELLTRENLSSVSALSRCVNDAQQA